MFVIMITFIMQSAQQKDHSQIEHAYKYKQ